MTEITLKVNVEKDPFYKNTGLSDAELIAKISSKLVEVQRDTKIRSIDIETIRVTKAEPLTEDECPVEGLVSALKEFFDK